jgi:hypothetical protein
VPGLRRHGQRFWKGQGELMQLFEWGIASNASGQPGLHVVGISGSAPSAQAQMLIALDAVPARIRSRGWVTRLALGDDRLTYDRLDTFVLVNRDGNGVVQWLANAAGSTDTADMAGNPADPARQPKQKITVDGSRLQLLRQAQGLSRERLAWDAGVSVTTLVRLESQPRPQCLGRTLTRLADVLGENPRALVSTAPPDRS